MLLDHSLTADNVESIRTDISMGEIVTLMPNSFMVMTDDESSDVVILW